MPEKKLKLADSSEKITRFINIRDAESEHINFYLNNLGLYD